MRGAGVDTASEGNGLRVLGLVIGLVALLTVGCGDGDAASTMSDDMPTCATGATDVIEFLQRTLDEIGNADAAAVAAYEERFALGVDGLLQRAQEMHCTEEGFNKAVIARLDELEPNGPVGEALVERVGEIGLGSLDPMRGGPLTLPGV